MNVQSNTIQPGGFERGYEESAAIAYNKLSTANIDDICHRLGAVQETKTTLSLVFIGQTYHINFAEHQINMGATPAELSIQLIILHYLTGANFPERQIRPITFNELKEGFVYYPTFLKRCVKPLIEYFGHNPQKLVQAGKPLGAVSIERGDGAIYLQALPRIGINIVLWRGDEELPTAGTVYFSSDIEDYLPTEDIAVLGQSCAYQLISQAVLDT